MSSAQNTVLQLLPPKVRLATDPVIGARIGVPLHAVIFYNPRTGVKSAEVTIDPPIVGTIKKGDDLRLWATDDPTLVGPVAEQDSGLAIAPILLDAISIEEDDPAEPMQMYIAGSAFLVGVVLYLFYTIDRPSGNVGASQALTLIHNRIRPGLKDRLTVAGGHSELKFRLSDAIKNGVGPDFVSAQVAVEYPYCRAYDRILFKCNGETMEIGVSADEAPKPPDHGSEIVTTINFTVNRAFLERAKRIDHLLSFLFTAFDQLDNSADPDAQWSPPQTVVEDLDGLLFLKAILREIEGDTTDEPEIIDLKKLSNNDLTVAILTADARIEVGDEIEGVYTATRTGYPDVVEALKGIVEKGDFEPKKTCILKVPNHKVILGSSVTVTYEVKRNGVPIGKSQTAKAQVVGTYLELKPPSVLQASGATLDPMAGLTRLTVVVPQGTTLPTDLLSVCWTAKPGTHAEGSIVTAAKPISEIGLNIDISSQLMAFSLGDVVSVSYIITRDGEKRPSETLTLTVQNLPQSALIAPRLKEADSQGEGAELKLANLTPQGKMWCPGFPLNAEGQFVWLLFKGTNADDSPFERYIWASPFAYVNAQWIKDGFFEALAPYEDLIGLKDRSDLSIEMFIAFGKSEELGLAKRFVLRRYTVSAVEDVAPTIESVKDSRLQEIDNGGVTVDTAVTISGAAAKGQKVDILNNDSFVVGVVADAISGRWALPLTGLTERKHSFVAKAQYGTGQSSAPRALTVTALLTPTLTNVRDETGEEVPDNGFTVSKTLTLSGQASAFQEVEIFDGVGSAAVSCGKAIADAATNWQKTLTVDLGERVFFARSLYHSDLVDSNVRKLAVVKPLTIDPTLMRLSGYSVKIPNWPKTGQDSYDNTAQRVPTSGGGNYTYRSSNVAIATVTAQGKVVGNKNGRVTIFIKDQFENEASYEVEVSNTWRMVVTEGPLTNQQAVEWRKSIGGVAPGTNFINDANRVYIPPHRTNYHWLGIPQSPGVAWVVTTPGSRLDLTARLPDDLIGAWCVISNG